MSFDEKICITLVRLVAMVAAGVAMSFGYDALSFVMGLVGLVFAGVAAWLLWRVYAQTRDWIRRNQARQDQLFGPSLPGARVVKGGRS